MNDEEYEGLVANAYQYLNEALDSAKAEYKLGSYERYDYSQTDGTLSFSSGEKVRVVVEVDAVGTWSPKSETWLWAWGNESILEPIAARSAQIRSFGEEHSLRELVEPYWPATQEDAWAMTAVMAYLLEARGAYRCPDGGAYLFLIFRELHWAT